MGLLDRFRTVPAPKADRARAASGRAHFDGYLELDEQNVDLQGTTGLRTFDKMWRTDADVRKAVTMVVTPLVSASFSVEPYAVPDPDGDGSVVEDQDREVAEFVEWALLEGMRPRLPSHLLQALTVVARSGFAPFEQVWARDRWNDRDVLTLKTLDLRLPRTIQRWVADKGELSALEQFLPDVGNILIPAHDLVYYRLGAEGDNWEGQSLLRPAYKHWLYKDRLERVDAMGHERFSMGIPVGYPPASAIDDDLDAFEDLLKDMRANEAGYALLPGPHAQHAEKGQGWFVHIMTPDSRGEGNGGIIESISMHRDAISASVIAEFMRLGQSGTGARATADVQQDPFLLYVESIASTVIEDTINEQIIPRLVALNFSTDRLPKLSMSLIDSTTLGELADFIQKLSAAGAIRTEPTLEAYLRDRADLPPADEDAIAEQEAVEAEQAAAEMEQQVKIKQAMATPPPGQQLSLDASHVPEHETVTLARADRELTPWERTMSLDAIEVAIDDARARFEAAGGPAARAFAADVAAKAVRGRGKLPTVKTPDGLADALLNELRALYLTGRRTVVEELFAQEHGNPTELAQGDDPDEIPGEAAALLRLRAEAAAEQVTSQTVAAITRALLLRGRDQAALQAAGELAAGAALRSEAQFNAAGALNAGRVDQAEAERDRIAGVRYTAILDGRACRSCLAADDGVLRRLDDPVRLARIPPNPACEGGARCRCLEAYQLAEEAAPSI